MVLPIALKSAIALRASASVNAPLCGYQAVPTYFAPSAFAAAMTLCGFFLSSSRPTCIDVACKSAARSPAANCSGVIPYRPAVSTWVTPIERASLNMLAGSFDIERRLQSCSPTGAPTEPIERTLLADVDVAPTVGEPTETARD